MTNIEKHVGDLKKASHAIHDEQLKEESGEVAALWTTVAEICSTLKTDIDTARSLIFPRAFTP